MEKINTPLQLAQKEISDYKKKEPNNDDYHRGVQSGLSIAIDLIKRFDEIEREVIEKAFEYGQDMVEAVSHEWRDDLSEYEYHIHNTMGAKTYFTQTFKR